MTLQFLALIPKRKQPAYIHDGFSGVAEGDLVAEEVVASADLEGGHPVEVVPPAPGREPIKLPHLCCYSLAFAPRAVGYYSLVAIRTRA